MAKTNKEFKTKTYAVVAFLLVLTFLISVCTVTFKNKYNGFDPEKVAIAFTETIVNRGDGYNAYKNTIVSKDKKYGDYIRENFMYPIIYAQSNYTAGMDTNGLKGLNDETYMGEKTKTDNGTLAGQVIDRMYPFYLQLVTELNGWDKFNTFFTRYFAELVKVREEIFGDKYMTDEIMFTVLEANVSAYGDELVGTEDVVDENSNVQLSEKNLGVYERKYGENCVFTYEAIKTEDMELNEYKSNTDKNTFKNLEINVDDIKEVKVVTVRVKTGDNTVIDAQKVTVVKTGGQWYVDNTKTNTAELYNFYK